MIWDAKTGAIIGEPLKGNSNTINSVFFSPDGTRIVTENHDVAIIWDAKTGAMIGDPFKCHSGNIRSVSF